MQEKEKSKISNSLKALFGILISIFFLWLVFRKVDVKDVILHIKNLNFKWVFLFFVVSLFNYAIKGLRWSALTVDDYKHSPVFIRTFLIGMMLNNVLPLRMGDIVRAYLVSKKTDIPKSKMLGTVVIERIFDLLSLFILLSIFLLIAKDLEVPLFVQRLSKLGILLGFSGFFFLTYISRTKKQIFKKLNSLHDWRILKKLTRLIDLLLEGFQVLNKSHHVLGIILFSLFIWFSEAFTFYLVGLGFGVELGFFPYILVMIMICLGTMIPSGPGYIGVFEGATVGAMVIFGIDPEISLAYALVLHFLQVFLISIAGFICLLKEGLSFKKLKDLGA